ncbi:MAG: hypothetical protein COX29_04245 [Candidatus Moranbacteria bacterium CG23_combo_of_CG06-09_8_20_14_all_35_22]|nr:MAG: hypothetical protein COX29_04245 [Candidatus Moranbacteria bacterium CG23_combo_of_CG06-09_8_20_14_all_35_22]
MQYYHNIITQKSFDFLKEFNADFDFVLIGGWAVFLYSRALKSKDIDIIVDYENLAKLKEKFAVFKNDRLKKYEIQTGEFDVDIYVSHYSYLGVEVSEIEKRVFSKKGFQIPELEALFILKLFAWHNRRGSAKGQKDELDIFSLTFLPEFDWKKYWELIKLFNFSDYHKNFTTLLKKTRQIPELNINKQQMAKIRKTILEKLESSKFD